MLLFVRYGNFCVVWPRDSSTWSFSRRKGMWTGYEGKGKKEKRRQDKEKSENSHLTSHVSLES